MPSQHAATPVERQARFALFHAELAPVLVDFIDVLGIEPPREVLTQAVHYLPYVERALQDMAIADAEDRSWLLARMMYFDLPCPRKLSDLVADIEQAMQGPARPGLH
jgi:hypothetical protein